MANLLAHALFALAASSIPTSLLHGAPLTEYGFYAALAALPPDLEMDHGTARRTPYGHSVAYGLLWAFLVLSALGLAGWSGLLSPDAFPLLLSACLTGLGSHLVLDALTEPGIFTWPNAHGEWGRVAALRRPWVSVVNPIVSGASVGAILTLLVLY